MNAQDLIDTARTLVAGDKGLLAMDESNPTCNKRFAKLGIPQTEEARRAYRELIVTTPGLAESISGAILYDETIRQQKKDGTPFVKVLTDAGIIPGIKVDTGAKDMAGHPREKVTEGLDGLRERLAEYSEVGARFAKWRAVIVIGDGLPSRGCIEANAQALARYSALCQEAGIVPVVEPEVLMDGEHTLEQCAKVTEEVLPVVFGQLYSQRVMLEGMILKPNMVLPGLTCRKQDAVVNTRPRWKRLSILMSLRLYLIRHGETEWSLTSQHTGRTDIPLTARGEDEARELAQGLRDIAFAHVMTSPQQRARKTCELAGLGSPAVIDPDLAEWDYGDYEGQRSVDIRKQRAYWNVFRDGCPGGETPAQVSDRADRLIAHLRALDGNVALFNAQ